MARRRPRLDLTLPDRCRQIGEFCAEFIELDYADIRRACDAMSGALARIIACGPSIVRPPKQNKP